METNAISHTRIDEIGDGLFRIHTPVSETVAPGGFSFNQYLLVDDAPLLFHTGPRQMHALVAAAIARVMPVASLRYIGFSHHESDEDGSINEFLAAAPQAQAVSGRIYAMINGDLTLRPPLALADGETLSLGDKKVRWLDAPHLPHAWECGFLFEETDATLFAGDLFTQPGSEHPALTESDLLEPSEAFRRQLDYASHSTKAAGHLERLAGLNPKTLACMHGAAWTGDGGRMLRALAEAWREE